MSVVIVQEPADTPDAAALVTELEAQLSLLYPQESRHGFSVEKLVREGVVFFVVRVDGQPAGCGGVQFVDGDFGELKRMYVRPPFRRCGLGKLLLTHLADHTRQHGLNVLRLETGVHQVEAIRLYERFGFRRIEPFAPYRVDAVSICFEMRLAART
ncbi:MAG TPA: GNAT family N-acetyltransferase [Tepidisphaeraceae bacterium]|jgi:ribosomal protein S18 acetylase RimI-like enzyme